MQPDSASSGQAISAEVSRNRDLETTSAILGLQMVVAGLCAIASGRLALAREWLPEFERSILEAPHATRSSALHLKEQVVPLALLASLIE